MSNKPSDLGPSNSAEAMFWDEPCRPARRPSAPPVRALEDDEPPVSLLPHRQWEWRYSWAFGVMYGPIPIGILIGLPILLAIR